MSERSIATKRTTFRNQELDDEFKNVYEFLTKMDLGAFSFYYNESNGKLYLQHFNQETQQNDSVARIDSDGNLDVTGAVNGAVTLENPGRG